METKTTPPKPSSVVNRSELTRLPEITTGRRITRTLLLWVARVLVGLCLRVEVIGKENIPDHGPLVIVSNHLGDADTFVGRAISSLPIDFIAKAELYDIPLLGRLFDAYGVIWIHRGQPDRRALRAALEGLAQGRIVALAPEGRESVTGALEEGTDGAAYLALRSQAPVLPVTLTGTENWRIRGNLKRLRRTRVKVTIGPAFRLKEHENRHLALKMGTQKIMLTLAQQLPGEYQGVYQGKSHPG
jgi:1-acyl-sn-glycerol-3-phosphate acyltransferase